MMQRVVVSSILVLLLVLVLVALFALTDVFLLEVETNMEFFFNSTKHHVVTTVAESVDLIHDI